MTSYSWASALGGNWNASASWTPGGGPPTSNDTATLSITGSDYSITVNSADFASSLTLSSANVYLQVAGAAGVLTLGALAMSAGRIDVASASFANGTLAVSGAFALSAGTLNINSGGALALGSLGALTQTGGTVNLYTGGTISGGAISSTAGNINWSGGTLSGTTVAGPLTLATSGAQLHWPTAPRSWARQAPAPELSTSADITAPSISTERRPSATRPST